MDTPREAKIIVEWSQHGERYSVGLNETESALFVRYRGDWLRLRAAQRKPNGKFKVSRLPSLFRDGLDFAIYLETCERRGVPAGEPMTDDDDVFPPGLMVA